MSQIKSAARLAAAWLGLSLACAVLIAPSGAAQAQGTPVLSRTQITLAQGIDAVISIRMEPRRGALSTLLAQSVEDDLQRLFLQYFPDTPVHPPVKGQPLRVAESGRVTCRLIARDRDDLVAVFTRCTLGNLRINIINREDIALVPRSQAVPATRALLEDAMRRIAFSYRKARGKNPVWIPQADKAALPQ